MNRKTFSLDVTKWVAYIISALLILITLRLLSWSLQPQEIFKINKDPIPVLTKQVKKYDGAYVVRVEYDFCKMQSVDSINNGVQPRLVSNKTEIDLKSYTENSDAGCRSFEAPVLLPPQAQPDTYRLEWKACYNLNPLKKNVCEEYRSEEFQVIP